MDAFALGPISRVAPARRKAVQCDRGRLVQFSDYAAVSDVRDKAPLSLAVQQRQLL